MVNIGKIQFVRYFGPSSNDELLFLIQDGEATVDDLLAAAASTDNILQAAAARNSMTPSEVLKEFSDEEYSYVHFDLATNEKLPAEVFAALHRSKYRDMHEILQENAAYIRWLEDTGREAANPETLKYCEF